MAKSLAEDLYSDKLLNNPYSVYKQIRDLGSAVWLPKRRLWAIGRFDEVRLALRSDAALISGNGVVAIIRDPLVTANLTPRKCLGFKTPFQAICSGDAFQCDVTSHQLPYPSFKALARHHTDLQTKAAQDSTNAQFYVDKPPEKLLARNQQCSHLLRAHRFGVHRTEPTHPDQLGKPARILAVSLHHHCL